MYAVIATGGKQYRVEVGDVLDVEKLDGGQGTSVTLRPVMIVDDDGGVTAGSAALAAAGVTADVVEQRRDRKLTVFKYKPKTRYRRKAGHRQPRTRIKVTDIRA